MIRKEKDGSSKREAARVVPILLLSVSLLAAAACSGGKIAPESLEVERAPVELRAEIDRAVAYPGDVITFTLEAEYAPGVELELPDIADRFSEFRMIDAGETPPEERAGGFFTARWYKLQADTAGSYVVEPLIVAYTLPDGRRETLKTPKIFLEIVTLLAEEGALNDIRDIKPPVEISSLYRLALMILAALLAVILIASLARRAFKRWRRRAVERKQAPRPPHEAALEALERLLAKKLIEQGRQREFCFEISEIFRRYMDARFDVPAVDLTTEEILPQIEQNGIVEENLKPLVREFLTSTDLVKFARHLPTNEEIDKIIRDTRAFINGTALQAAQAEGGEAQ